MTSHQNQGLAGAGIALTARITISAVIATAGIAGAGAGLAHATGGYPCGGNSGGCVDAVKTGIILSPEKLAATVNTRPTAVQSGRGTANNVAGGVKPKVGRNF